MKDDTFKMLVNINVKVNDSNSMFGAWGKHSIKRIFLPVSNSILTNSTWYNVIKYGYVCKYVNWHLLSAGKVWKRT